MSNQILVFVCILFIAVSNAFSPLKNSLKARKLTVSMSGSPGETAFVPDMTRRTTMNNILVASVGISVLGLAAPYLSFFVPPGTGGGSGGTVAKDALGNDITVASWKASHLGDSRELVQGLKGDATYLILDENKNLADFALNAVCTHLGCVVPWNKAENKFMCPCHGSQYNKEGKVIRGPAPLSLALAHREEDSSGKVILRTWTETDFRTGEAPWWK